MYKPKNAPVHCMRTSGGEDSSKEELSFVAMVLAPLRRVNTQKCTWGSLVTHVIGAKG